MMIVRIVAASLFVTWAVSTAGAASPAAAVGSVSGPSVGVPVRNYGIVEPGVLSRSAQPTHSGYVWLHRHGVVSVVNLTLRDVGEPYLKEIGFENYLWLPLQGPPTEAEAERFLKFIVDSRNWPLHVHCHAGKDRAGGLVALVRYAVYGWSLEQALEEAKLYRQGKVLLPKWIDWLTNWAQNHPPGAFRPVSYPPGRPSDGQ